MFVLQVSKISKQGKKKREQGQKDVLEFEDNLEKKNSDDSGEFEDELDSEHELEGKAQPAAGGVPQLTVGGAPQHTGMSKTDQTEWFSSPRSENSAADFMRMAPGRKPMAVYLHC